MINVENVDVWGFDHAIRGMRNPMNSWDKSDSFNCMNYSIDCDFCKRNADECNMFYIGEDDLDLMSRLFKAGTEHRTYARMIQVSMDITAPLYWWKEMDRYTIGKSQVSCSTMHKIAEREFRLDDFSHEHLIPFNLERMEYLIELLNANREIYRLSKKKEDWWQLIQLLPSSYNQKRTVCMSYETVFKIIKERTGHKLDEWNDFVSILKALPYVNRMMGETENV